MTLARDLGYTVTRDGAPARGALHRRRGVLRRHRRRSDADPVDRQDQIGAGRRGPVTEALQRAFFDVINGEVPDTHGWLTYVYPDEALAARAAAATAGAGARAGAGASG